MFSVEVISSPVPTLKSQLQDQSSQRRRGNPPPSSSGRSSASTLKSSTPDRRRRSPPLIHASTSPAVNRKKRAAVLEHSRGWILRDGTSEGNLLLLPKGNASGLYATSGPGVCTAGKRKGLLWKEVDDVTAEMLPHISSVLMFLVLCCFGQHLLASNSTKETEL